MSLMYNEYIIASNNSINDNKYNAQKVARSPSYKIKQILKPILKMLKNKKQKKQIIKQNAKNTSMESCEDYWSSEIDDNSANEELESRIFNEIQQCQNDAAVYIYENNECELRQVQQQQNYVPVHFARTDAGTFFWTTMSKPVDADLIQPTFCCSGYQQPELQYGDRWVQA